MATPVSSRPAKISPFALATPSISPKPSKWAGPALLITATVGLAICVKKSISLKWLAPISITA